MNLKLYKIGQLVVPTNIELSEAMISTFADGFWCYNETTDEIQIILRQGVIEQGLLIITEKQILSEPKLVHKGLRELNTLTETYLTLSKDRHIRDNQYLYFSDSIVEDPNDLTGFDFVIFGKAKVPVEHPIVRKSLNGAHVEVTLIYRISEKKIYGYVEHKTISNIDILTLEPIDDLSGMYVTSMNENSKYIPREVTDRLYINLDK